MKATTGTFTLENKFYTRPLGSPWKCLMDNAREALKNGCVKRFSIQPTDDAVHYLVKY